MRVNIKEQILNLIAFVFVQLPLLYKLTLFDKAFGFFYVGFLLKLPPTISRSYQMILGFLVGLLIDIFSNTPGIHAGACVLMMFIRDFRFFVVETEAQDPPNVNVRTVKKRGGAITMLPLVLIHHLFIFTVENSGFGHFNLLFPKILYSTVFSFLIVYIVGMLTAQRKYRG